MQGILYSINPRRSMSRHTLITLVKRNTKEKNIKISKENVTYKGNPIRLPADLSAETLQARRKWHDVF